MDNNTTIVYTDGACSKGNGGWAAMVIKDGSFEMLWDREPDTTNNRMELQAAIKAIEHADSKKIHLFSDSKYVVDGIIHMRRWKRNNWCTRKGTPAANQDLWKTLDKLTNNKHVKFHHVKGHADDPTNNLVDEFAQEARSCVGA